MRRERVDGFGEHIVARVRPGHPALHPPYLDFQRPHAGFQVQP